MCQLMQNTGRTCGQLMLGDCCCPRAIAARATARRRAHDQRQREGQRRRRRAAQRHAAIGSHRHHCSRPRARDDVRRRRNWHFKWRRPGPAVLARSSQSGSPPPPRRRAAARRPAAAAAAVPRANLGSAARRGGAAVGVARRPGGASLKLGLLHPRAPAWPRTAHVRSRPSKAASSCYLNNTQPWCAPSSQRTRRAPRASGSVPVAHQLAPGRRSAPGPPHLSLRDI